MPPLHGFWGSKPGPCAYKDSTPLAVPSLRDAVFFSWSFRNFLHVWPDYRQPFLLNVQALSSKGLCSNFLTWEERNFSVFFFFFLSHCDKQGLVILHTHIGTHAPECMCPCIHTHTGHSLWTPTAWASGSVTTWGRCCQAGSQPRRPSLQISQLNALITLLIGNLSPGDRMKIMTICTIDVHARDVVAKMIMAKAGAPLSQALGRQESPGCWEGLGTGFGAGPTLKNSSISNLLFPGC